MQFSTLALEKPTASSEAVDKKNPSLRTSQIFSSQIRYVQSEAHGGAQLELATFGSCYFVQVPKQLWQLLRNLSQSQSVAGSCRTSWEPLSACLIPAPSPQDQGVLGSLQSGFRREQSPRERREQAAVPPPPCTEAAFLRGQESTCFPALSHKIGSTRVINWSLLSPEFWGT